MRLNYGFAAEDANPLGEQVRLVVEVTGEYAPVACLLDQIRMAFQEIESETTEAVLRKVLGL